MNCENIVYINVYIPYDIDSLLNCVAELYLYLQNAVLNISSYHCFLGKTTLMSHFTIFDLNSGF